MLVVLKAWGGVGLLVWLMGMSECLEAEKYVECCWRLIEGSEYVLGLLGDLDMLLAVFWVGLVADCDVVASFEAARFWFRVGLVCVTCRFFGLYDSVA